MKPLGIKPIVDFAFKKIFGSPENITALIGLLNAILRLPQPVVFVEIRNPFSYQEFAESKQIVLDVRCRDSAGRWFNVEMQVAIFSGLLERLVYYACSMYVDQLTRGDSYTKVSSAISICLLRSVLFPQTDQAHHRFQLMDEASGRVLENAIEVHTVELTKYKPFPKRRRTSRCTISARKLSVIMSGRYQVPVKRDAKRAVKRVNDWDC